MTAAFFVTRVITFLPHLTSLIVYALKSVYYKFIALVMV